MPFSFNATANTSQSNIKPRLEANTIHTVRFDGCEIVDIQGVKDSTAVYKVIKLKFSNGDGTYEHTVFEPRESDFSRTVTTFNDKNTGEEKEIPQSSNVENMMLLFKHAIDSIVPAIGKEIDAKTKNIGAKNWEDLRLGISKMLDSGIGTIVQIKLLSNSKTGDGEFPRYFSGVNREGVAYIRNNFIGKKLAFSSYEMTKIKNAAAAKPTPIDQGPIGSFDLGGSSKEMDLDFDDLPML